MSKHTPGPWKYDRHESRIIAPNSDRHTVGRFHSGRNDAGNDARPILADAYLIAAAPDLLEALEELTRLMEAVHQHEYEPDTFTTQPARLAIAKAKRQAP